ncbi:MAG: hypothetical protein SVG88_00345 [Halobacteriales archaeon]|nr:hypothetical protein [Halobacteriales archaeon]
MERFAWFVTVGGLLLVAGLWLIRLHELAPILGVLGGAVAGVGGGSLCYGIAIELELGAVVTDR